MALHVVSERLWWNKEPMVGIERETRERLQEKMQYLAYQRGVACMNVLWKLRTEHYCVDGIHLNNEGQRVCGVEGLERLVDG
jgi:hypothetical protein